MTALPITRRSLLMRLRDPADADAWATFLNCYAEPIYRAARRAGLQDADAADLLQDVLRSVAQAIGGLNYDPARGRFRSWLFTLVRNRLRDRARRSVLRGSGDSAIQARLEAIPIEEDFAAFRADAERRIFHAACAIVQDEVQPQTWAAFQRTALDGVGTAATAKELGLSIAAVYLARSRVLARLRATVAEIRVGEGDEE